MTAGAVNNAGLLIMVDKMVEYRSGVDSWKERGNRKIAMSADSACKRMNK